MKTKSNAKAQSTETRPIIFYVVKLLSCLVYSHFCFVYVINLTEIRFLALAYFCFSLCCIAIKVQQFESAYNGAYKELNFICLLCFLTHILHFKCRYFLVFCLRKNTTLQKKLVYLPLSAVDNIGF